MQGQVYLVRDLRLTLCSTLSDSGSTAGVGFSGRYRLIAKDIARYSRKASDQDNALLQHLKQLLQDNENSVMGVVGISGEVRYDQENIAKPKQTDTQFQKDRMDISLNGSLLWLLAKLGQEDNQNNGDVGISIKIQFKNLFAGKVNENVANQLVEMRATSHCKDVCYNNNAELFRHSVHFHRNPATWRNLFGGKSVTKSKKAKSGPTLSLVVCANLSKRMTQPWIIIPAYGQGCRLTQVLQEIADKRRKKVEKGKKTDAMIVAESGKEFPVYQEWLKEGSPVFKAMLENKNFEEGRTKRIKLPDLEDNLVECMLAYLYYFDMKACVNDLGLGVKMLEVAERFQMDGLKTGIETLFLNRYSGNFTIGEALHLFAFTRHLDHFRGLTRKAFRILQCHKDKLKGCPEFQEMFRKEPEFAMELCKSAVETGMFYL